MCMSEERGRQEWSNSARAGRNEDAGWLALGGEGSRENAVENRGCSIVCCAVHMWFTCVRRWPACARRWAPAEGAARRP